MIQPMYFECHSNIPTFSCLGAGKKCVMIDRSTKNFEFCVPVNQRFLFVGNTDPGRRSEGEEGKGKVAVRFRLIVEETSTKHSRAHEGAKGARREGREGEREGPLSCRRITKGKGRRDGSKG